MTPWPSMSCSPERARRRWGPSSPSWCPSGWRRSGCGPGWLVPALRLPWQMARDTVIVFAALWRRLARGEQPPSGFREIPVRFGSGDAEGETRRVLLVGGRSRRPQLVRPRDRRASAMSWSSISWWPTRERLRGGGNERRFHHRGHRHAHRHHPVRDRGAARAAMSALVGMRPSVPSSSWCWFCWRRVSAVRRVRAADAAGRAAVRQRAGLRPVPGALAVTSREFSPTCCWAWPWRSCSPPQRACW